MNVRFRSGYLKARLNVCATVPFAFPMDEFILVGAQDFQQSLHPTVMLSYFVKTLACFMVTASEERYLENIRPQPFDGSHNVSCF